MIDPGQEKSVAGTSSFEGRLEFVEGIVRSDPSILSTSTLGLTESNASDQQEDFIAGKPIELEYPNIDIDRLRERELVLRGLILKLVDNEDSLPAQAMYRALEWRHSEICMWGWAAEMMEEPVSQGAHQEAAEWFLLANEALHGKPKNEIFSAIAQREISPLLEGEIPADHVNASGLQRELKNLLGDLAESDYEIFEPDPEIIKTLSAVIKTRFKSLIDPIDPDEEYTPEDVALCLEACLDAAGLSEEGWQVEINPTGANLSVRSGESKVVVGQNRGDIAGKTLQSRAIHEIGVHALRTSNALRADMMSAAYGQDSYLEFEEGCAGAFEDAFSEDQKVHGMQYYLAVGLAEGLDGHDSRDMRGVFEIVWRYKALQEYGGEDITGKDINRAKNIAFKQCVRIYRGTKGLSPGLTYTKDLAYFNGQEKAWSVLKDVRVPDDLELILAGKLDLTDDFHRRLAEDIAYKSA